MSIDGKPIVRLRGFAALSVEDRRRIASMGGIAAHEKGIAHQFTTKEAILAGRTRGQKARESAQSSNSEVSESASDSATRML